MTREPVPCVACGETLQTMVRFCPFCGAGQQAVPAPVVAVATPPPVVVAVAEAAPASAAAAAPAAAAPVRPTVQPASRPPPPPIVPIVAPAAPPLPPKAAPPPAVARQRRPPSPAQRAARVKAARQLALAALILGCGAILWHHLTSGPHGTITVRLSQPAAGEVVVDGADTGAPGRAIRLPPGRHVLGFESPGWTTGTVTVRLHDGEARTVTLSPVAHRASLSLDSVPGGARLSLDGRAIGRAPRTLSLLPGRYRIGASLPGRLAAEQPVALEAGEQRALSVTLQPVPERSLRLVAPVGSWSEPVMLHSGDRFSLRFRGRIRLRAGGQVVLLEGGAPAALGVLDDRSLCFTAVGDVPVALDLRVGTAG